MDEPRWVHDLPENEQTYNNSAVQDVSDNGRVAVGQLSSCEVEPDSPPQQAFVWTAESGLVLVDDLMAAFGQPDPHYYTCTDVSRDGNRVLVVGNPPLSDAQDTPDLTLDLAWPTPIPKLEGLDGLSRLHRLIPADHTL